MKLIFIQSKNNRNSITALCGAVEKERLVLKVKIVEEKDLFKKIRKDSAKTIIAFSFQTPDIFRIAKLIPRIRKISKDFIIVAGGAHPSGAPKQTLKMGFDFVFIGEAEETFVDFLKKIIKGKKISQKIVKSTPVDISKYSPISEKYKAFGPIEITRGCLFGCHFCQTTYLFGKMRHRTIGQITEATKILVRSGRTDIRFVSPNILSYGSKDGIKPNLNKLEEMLKSVRAVKGVRKVFAGSFPSEVRPEQLNKRALEIIKKYCDNDNLIIGAQSGSSSMLKKCHRRHGIIDVHRAIKLTLEAGFKANVDFIFGMPGETKKEEQETIDFIKELVTMKNVRIHGHTFLPLPGTPWEKEKPGKISPQMRTFLKNLRSAGKEYGDWEEQERMGERLIKEFEGE